MRIIDWWVTEETNENKFKLDLRSLFKIFEKLISKFKEVFKDEPEFIEKLSDFLNIPEFIEYIKKYGRNKIEEHKFIKIKNQMLENIKKIVWDFILPTSYSHEE